MSSRRVKPCSFSRDGFAERSPLSPVNGRPGAKAPFTCGILRRAKALRSLRKGNTLSFSGTCEAVSLGKTDFFDSLLSLGFSRGGGEADFSATAAKAPRLHPSQQSCLGARPPVEMTGFGLAPGFDELRIGVAFTMWSIWFRRVRFRCSWCGRRIRSGRRRSRSRRRPGWSGGPSRCCRSWDRRGCGEGI
jgi:hypothetical protein